MDLTIYHLPMGDNNIVKKCASLTAEQSDAIFFPTVGQKVTKSRNFCATCPFRSPCLITAVTEGLQGFYAGTTEGERRNMKNLVDEVKNLSTSIDAYLPKTGRRRSLRMIVVVPDPYSYLDEVEPSAEELDRIV